MGLKLSIGFSDRIFFLLLQRYKTIDSGFLTQLRPDGYTTQYNPISPCTSSHFQYYRQHGIKPTKSMTKGYSASQRGCADNSHSHCKLSMLS